MENDRISEFEARGNIEIKHLFDVVRQKIWMLALGLLLGAGLAALYTYFQPPVYEAFTRVLVTRSSQSQSNDIASAASIQQTADTYVQFLTMEPVLNIVSERVGYKVDAKSNMIRVSLVPNTQIINVAVDDTDAKRAALIADSMVQVLIEQNEVLQTGRYADSEDSLQTQISEMEKQIAGAQDQLDQAKQAALQNEMANIQAKIDEVQKELIALENASSGEKTEPVEETVRREQLQSLLSSYQDAYTTLVVTGEILGTNDQITRLEKNLDLYQQLYLNLLGSLESVRMARMQNTPNVVQISPAIVSETPVRPRPTLNVVLGGIAGLILAIGVFFAVEFLDDTIKTPADVERFLGSSVLGYITEVSKSELKQGHLDVAKQPRAPVAEAFRSLRANLEFAGINHPLRTILVTSAAAGEGKSTIAANLASIIAQAGRRVILVDADLRRPTLHLTFDLNNHTGLTDVFRERSNVYGVMQSVENDSTLSVLTTGSLPPNPTELLASDKMNAILSDLKKQTAVVIVDSAPAIVSDAQVLAAKVDGVLLVVRPGKTHREELRATLEQFKRAGAHVIGVVLNRIPQNRNSYYGGYKQYSPYLYDSNKSEPAPAADVKNSGGDEKE
jgi:capsular exopolysaccharide synthesis family protein